jgi:nucleotide-binding universal stress UspA family protein
MPGVSDQVGLTVDRIVLATDFSTASTAAADYAKRIARRFSSCLTLAHVVDGPAPAGFGHALKALEPQNGHRDATEKMERQLVDFDKSGIRATGQTLDGRNPAEAIVGLAQELESDLIVTGTHARRGLSKILLGSCAEGIIRHAECPVLTIGPKAKKPLEQAISFRTIVFATDLSPGAAHKAAVALAFAQDSMSKIYFSHISERTGRDLSETLERQFRFEAALRKLIPHSSYDWCSPECVVEEGKVAQHVLELAGEVGADLIVLGARRSVSWLAHLAEGVVGQVLAEAECPVMTICSS